MTTLSWLSSWGIKAEKSGVMVVMVGVPLGELGCFLG
jgi:hypothetical protein